MVAVLMPAAMFSQAQITTKKMKLEDFPEKVTKVVLSGNIFVDGSIEDAVKNRWTISPYEFCSMEEFEALKGKEDYYFLMTVTGQFRKEVEPGLLMLSLVKGGKGSDLSLDKMLEVVTIPICSAEYPSGLSAYSAAKALPAGKAPAAAVSTAAAASAPEATLRISLLKLFFTLDSSPCGG